MDRRGHGTTYCPGSVPSHQYHGVHKSSSPQKDKCVSETTRNMFHADHRSRLIDLCPSVHNDKSEHCLHRYQDTEDQKPSSGTSVTAELTTYASRTESTAVSI